MELGEEDNNNIDSRQMTPTLSISIKVSLIQYFGSGDA